jgi:hypothetical protein
MTLRLCTLSSFILVMVAPLHAGWQPTAPGQAHSCASETAPFPLAPAEVIQKRFDLYKQAGFDMLRVEGLGGHMVQPDGSLRDPAGLPSLLIARDSGFRLKLNLSTYGQAGWYFTAHPEAGMINEDGGRAERLAYWAPGLRPRVELATAKVLQYMHDHGLFKNVDLIAPDMGPASEPIYPAAWTQQGLASKPGEAFWFYGPQAQAAFVQAMQAKYGTIAAANAAWGAPAFASWDAVTIPPPGTRPGPLWNDLLTWYRDTKRQFIVWNLENFKRQLARYPEAAKIKLLLYVPGTHYTDEEWRQAVATGNGNAHIRLMCDSAFLIDTAVKEGAELQYTGFENEPEDRYLSAYLRDHGYTVPLWAENGEGASPQTGKLTRIFQELPWAGIDYTHTNHAFAEDTVTPSPFFSQMTAMLAQVKAAVASRGR